MKYVKATERTPDLQYAHPGDAGLDLYTGRQQLTLLQNTVERVGSGISVQLPEGHVGLVVIRSSLGSRGVTMANGSGVIDAGYRGEIGLLLLNTSFEPVVLPPYSKVAQLLVMPVARVKPTEVSVLDDSVRGSGGFGSTDAHADKQAGRAKLRCICRERFEREAAARADRSGRAVRDTSRWRHERPAEGVRLRETTWDAS